MSRARIAAVRLLPVLLLLAVYWPAVNTWFFQDDFGWLNLRHDVRSLSDLPGALFAPKAHGNMRPLGENAYWLLMPALFGAEPLPLHIATFVTQAAALLLLGGIAGRLTRSHLAAFAAQILWIADVAVAETLGWTSIYNQALSAFFFLLAFYLLIRFAENGNHRYEIAQWAAFVLGLGALETNVVYPALAAIYALLFARQLFRRVLPMFAVSALSVLVHFHFAPASSRGQYAPVLDGRIFGTAWTYWSWALGAMAVLLTVAIGVLVVADTLKRRYLPLLGLAWFFLPLAPYLLLPDHRMDYYLEVPAIGMAILGAAAVVESSRLPVKLLAAACMLVYLCTSVPHSLTVVRWQHERALRVENLVEGVAEARRQAPGKIILLEGIDTDLFHAGIADLPFLALSIPHVYLSPSEFQRIDAPPVLLSKYLLPAPLTRNALFYRFDGSMLHRTRGESIPAEDEPHFVNIADDVFQEYLGPGWSSDPYGLRRMNGNASARIGGPRRAEDRLYIGVFETHGFQLAVSANGVDLPVALAYRDLNLSEYRATLPAAASAWKSMDVLLKSDRPLSFGYLEVR